MQREPFSGNELHTASFLGTDAVAMLVVYQMSASYVARIMGDEELDWGATGRAASDLGVVSYRFLDVPDQGLSCVGFSHTMGETDDRGATATWRLATSAMTKAVRYRPNRPRT